VLGGHLTAFTNPAIETGLMHCRALLQFLGLCTTSDGRLGNVKKRRPGDIGIEKFSNASGPLPMVRPSEALACYRGASRGIPSLVVSYLYTPLNLPPPKSKIEMRPRPKAGS